jgi:hypothetical protein
VLPYLLEWLKNLDGKFFVPARLPFLNPKAGEDFLPEILPAFGYGVRH